MLHKRRTEIAISYADIGEGRIRIEIQNDTGKHEVTAHVFDEGAVTRIDALQQRGRSCFTSTAPST